MQCRKVEPNRLTLQECLDTDGVDFNSVSGKPIDESLTLKANSHKAGTGNLKHPVAVVGSLNEHEWRISEVAPTLTSSNWLQSPNAKTQKSGSRFAVMYRGPSGDRIYLDESPTIRSLANTNGNHQGGSGAWKVLEYSHQDGKQKFPPNEALTTKTHTGVASSYRVVKYKGEEYLVETGAGEEAKTLDTTAQFATNRKCPINLKTGKRKDLPHSYRGNPRPLTATEFERLMGWTVGCTAKGTTPDGKEIPISKTQRQKMLGNGIIPHEIKDICNKLKDFLASSFPSSHAITDSSR